MSARQLPRRGRTAPWLRRLGNSVSQSPLVAGVLARAAIAYLRFVFATNRWLVEPPDAVEQAKPHLPAIAVAWHGQHLLLPAVPFGLKAAVMISRNSDAEITARIVAAFGAEVVRASGGRARAKSIEKGSMKGFLDLLAALREGHNVFQTADVPHGTPRRAGMGVIALAKHSGRPIIPLAIASKRRWVFSRAWDRTTLNLPFGTSAFLMGAPQYVAADADAGQMEQARVRLEAELGRITRRAYELTGRPEPAK